jgi:hypothetical protein
VAASLSANATPTGGQKALSTVTITVAGHTATTAYYATVATPAGHTQTCAFKTDGSGAGSFTFVPQNAGTYTINSYLVTPLAAATVTLNAGGHS